MGGCWGGRSLSIPIGSRSHNPKAALSLPSPFCGPSGPICFLGLHWMQCAAGNLILQWKPLKPKPQHRATWPWPYPYCRVWVGSGGMKHMGLETPRLRVMIGIAFVGWGSKFSDRATSGPICFFSAPNFDTIGVDISWHWG